MELRDYQREGIQRLRTSIMQGSKRPVLVAPTGSGKTVLASAIVKSAAEKQKYVLVLAPRRELIYQFSAALEKFGIRHGVIMAGEPMSQMQKVQVASFDTLHSRGVRNEKIMMPKADLVLVDEAHLSIADTRKDIISAYPDSVVIGLTATPARGDGRGLGEIYNDLIVTTTVRELTDAGYLSPVRYFGGSTPDLEGLKRNREGDYQEKALAKRADKAELIGDVVHNWFRIASDRQTVVFAVNRAHSRHLCEEFQLRGVKAEHLDGETPLDERREILERVSSGETQVLCNVFVATFGLDIPSLSCAVLARPTRNISLYLQTAGRILRTCEGKTDAIIIDHAGAVDEHGFVDDFVPWSLDDNETVKERKQEQEQERKEPKEITCGDCGYKFKGQRICPHCGHEMIPPGKPIPIHEADLNEITRDGNKANRKTTWEEKIEFISQLRGYANRKGYNPGWVAHQYRDKFSVWPNDGRVKNAPAKEPDSLIMGWIKHQAIRRQRAAV
ncbi:MAG: DEAD/DEAH box helicase [Candidatus Thiodiazotropha lotti]|nr:DEAD/DEAH box helicase [Candidatus Thiodiazotropha lotti]